MAQRFYKIIVVCGVLFGSVVSQAQKYDTALVFQVAPRSSASIQKHINIQNVLFTNSKRPALLSAPLVFIRFPHPAIQKNFYTQHLAFFCRKEWELEKASGISLRIRMGSLQQCNFLEGKGR